MAVKSFWLMPSRPSRRPRSRSSRMSAPETNAFSPAPEDEHAKVVARRELLERRVHFLHRLQAQRVAHLGAVDGERGDALAHFQQDGLVFAHAPYLLRMTPLGATGRTSAPHYRTESSASPRRSKAAGRSDRGWSSSPAPSAPASPSPTAPLSAE